MMTRPLLSDLYNDVTAPELIASKRALPAILVINSNIELSYCNMEASDILKKVASFNDPSQEADKKHWLPERLLLLCKDLLAGKYPSKPSEKAVVFEDQSEKVYYAFRPVLIGFEKYRKEGMDPYILILIEKIVCQEDRLLEYKLTNRERDVVKLLVMGCTNKEISERLCISGYTTEDHLKHIKRKMGVKNRTAIAMKVTNHTT